MRGTSVAMIKAYMILVTNWLKVLLSSAGILSALRSKASASVGNCREAASPVPSMPGMYSIMGSSPICSFDLLDL